MTNELLKKTEKYLDTNYIDRLMSVSQCKQKALESFNNHLITRFSLFPFFPEVGIYNKDVLKTGFLTTEWAIEWLMYKWSRWFAAQTMKNHLKDRIDDYLDLFQEFDDEVCSSEMLLGRIHELAPKRDFFQQTIDKDFIFFVMILALCMQGIRMSQNIFLVKQESTLMNIVTGKNDSLKPMSAFTLIDRHPILSLPLYPMKGNVSTVINACFKYFGALPEWADKHYTLLGIEFSFLLFFVTRMLSSMLYHSWSAWVAGSTDILKVVLKSYKAMLLNPHATDQEKEYLDKMILKYVTQGMSVPFVEWMTYKVFWYGVWQTTANCIFAFPAWMKIGKSIYTLWSASYADTEAIV